MPEGSTPRAKADIGDSSKHRELNIDAWLEERYPADESLRRIFREIYELGGNVNHIQPLCWFITYGDDMRRYSPEPGSQRLSDVLGPPANVQKIPHRKNADNWNGWWEDLFLLAVTEHLKSQIDDPQYELTWELFTALHKHAKPKYTHDPKHHVADRIKRYKKAHQNWRDVLAYLESAAASIIREENEHQN